MSDVGGAGFERRTAQAWVGFQARLADRLAEMDEDDVLVVEVQVGHAAGTGATPYVQFAAGDGMLRGEVASNTYLAQEHALDAEQERALVQLGWSAPTAEPGEPEAGEGNFFVDLPETEADRLAVMATRTLRDVLGVLHPVFLSGHGLEVDEGAAVPVEPAAEVDEPAAVMPDDAEHLRELVDRALTPLFGQAPVHDGDGDIAVPWGSSVVYVHVDEERPVVELFGFGALDVTDLERAAFEVGVLNRDERFLKFVLEDDRVMARIHLPAWPFVPEHLRSMLTLMSSRLDELDEDLVARVGGLRAVDLTGDDQTDQTDEADEIGLDGDELGFEEDELGLEEDAEDDAGAGLDTAELHGALLTLLQLDADAVGSVHPELAASICGYDRALVLRLLGDTGRQEIAWREARDRAAIADKPLEAEACAHELDAWERTTTLLRAALREIVEDSRGRPPAAAGERRDTAVEPAIDPAVGEHRRVARKLFPGRPPRSCVIESVEDLVRFHEVADLDELDELLDAGSACDIEVVDLEDHLVMVVDEAVGRLEYPFTLADFQAMLQRLEETALDVRVPRVEED